MISAARIDEVIANDGLGVPLRELALVGVVSAFTVFLITSLVRLIAARIGAVAVPRDRDVHAIPTPRMGGVGMYLGVVVGIWFASELPALTRGFAYTTSMSAVLAAGAVIVVVGAIDDRWGIDALTKFVGQLTAAGVLVAMGVRWNQFPMPFGDRGTVVLDELQSSVLTVAFVVATINAVNFIDGLDGLAAGMGLITAGAILVFSIGLLEDQGGAVSFYPPVVLSVVLAGVCLGFLAHNFHPARIFMGDSGAMLIGLMLAAASTTASGSVSVLGYGPADLFTLLSPLLLVLAVVFIPMLDMLLAIVRRTRAGRSPFAPDKMHLHHRLLLLGHSHRRTVLIIYLWVAVLVFSAVAASVLGPTDAVTILAAGLVVALVVTIIPRLRGRLGH